jgi:SAM-dependent methyltransferase
VLDLGVGAGRTTVFFAPFARTYLGIDLAPRMIATCRERFSRLNVCDFQVGDAADLEHLTSASFDVVLFSFNGIDCLEPARREFCLRSVHRLLRPGGTFLFSAHNLQMINFYFRAPSAGSDEQKLLTPERRARIAQFNDAPASYERCDWALFWDGVYGDDGELRHVYIRPRHQLAQLRAAGFGQVHALSTVTGTEFSAADFEAVRDLSVAYSCEMEAPTTG